MSKEDSLVDGMSFEERTRTFCVALEYRQNELLREVQDLKTKLNVASALIESLIIGLRRKKIISEKNLVALITEVGKPKQNRPPPTTRVSDNSKQSPGREDSGSGGESRSSEKNE